MGWLSFLSRKSTPAEIQGGDLKAQAYDKTVAANPPIRGTYPVAGNGPSILEKFQKSHPHLRDGHFNDAPAPPPVVPRFLERPSTAPNHQLPEGSARPKSQSGTSARQLREPAKKRHGPYRLPSKFSTDQSDNIANSKSTFSPPSITLARDRNSSIFSGDSGSIRRFVDLLDAQASIKPSDFYGRVKAAGTKDFGEDVADRNILEKGSNLDSEQAQELHANILTLSIRSDESEDDRPPSSRKRYSMGSRLRTKSSSSNHSALPKTTYSEISQEHADSDKSRSAQKAGRRRSLHSYVPSPSIDRPRSASIGKRVKQTDPSYFPDYLRERARAAALEDLEDDLCTDSGPETKPARKHGIAVDLTDHHSYHARHDSKQTLPEGTDRPRSAKSSSRRRTMSNISSLVTVKPSSKRDSLQSFQSLTRRELIAERNLPSVGGNHSSSRLHHGTIADFDDSFYELAPLHSAEPPRLKPTRRHLSGRDELNFRCSNRSNVSVAGKSVRRSDIEETFPEWSGSVRRLSLTSETAGSTLSSNPFRPQSGHTTNTSVDLAPRVSVPKITETSEVLLAAGDSRIARESQLKIDTRESLYHEEDLELFAGSLVHSSRHQPSIDFVIDEDASSIDSFDVPQRSATEFEKDLLFQGYGFEGSQLPGLPGLLDVATPKARLTPSQRTQTTSAYKSPSHLAAFSSKLNDVPPTKLGPQYSSRSLQYASRPRSSHLRMPTFTYTDSDDSDGSELESESEDDLNFDIPLTRPGASRYHVQDNRRKYEMTTGHFREETDSEIPDLARVARLRREVKAKQRASNASLRKVKGKGKAPDIYVPKLGLDDPSSYADVES